VPHLSKRILEPKIKTDIQKSLVNVIKGLNDPNDIEKFLSSVLSDTEKMMIAKRVTAAFLLRHNVESAKIQEMLKLTPGTVFRLKLWIQTHVEGFNIVFDKLEREKRFEFAKEAFYKLLAYAIRTGSGRVPNPFKGEFRKGQLH